METSITSETISQQTICRESENIEIANDTDPKLNQSKDQMEIEQTRKNLMQAQEVYFKYFSSQKMAHTKATVRRRVEAGAKIIPDSQMSMAEAGTKTVPNSKTPIGEAHKVPQYGKTIKKIWKGGNMRHQ